MSPDEFSALAMDLGPGIQVRAILDTTLYRIGGKAFATLGWPASGWAVVKVSPARQAWALSLSDAAAPEPGRRRNAGIVLLRLATMEADAAAELLAEAWSFAHRAGLARGRAGAGGGQALVTSAL